MKNQKTPVKGKASGLVKALYVIAIVLMVIWVYMIIVNIMYISNYANTYGIAVSDMMMDAVQYVITGSISYFIYGVLVFCGGKIIRLIQKNAEACGDGGGEQQTAELSAPKSVAEDKAETKADHKEDVAEQEGDNQPEEVQGGPLDSDVEENAIPESEDAVEETEIIEDDKDNDKDDK